MHCTMSVMQPQLFRPVSAHTISFKEALFNDDKPCVVVSAYEPHEVEHVSQAFCKLYGLGEDEILSRTLRMVHGARTNGRLFSQKLKDATKGQRQDGQFFCYTKDCREINVNLQTVPVVGDCGQITHLLVTLAPVRDVEVAQDVAPAVEEDFCAPFDVFGSSVSASPKKDMFEGLSADEDAGFSADDIFFSAKDRPQDHLPKFTEDKACDFAPKPAEAQCAASMRPYNAPAPVSLTQRVTQLSNFVPWNEMTSSFDDTEDTQNAAPVPAPVVKPVSVPAPVNVSLARPAPVPAPSIPLPAPQSQAPSFMPPAPGFGEQMGDVSGEGDGQTLRLFRRKKHSGESCAGNDLAGPVDISLKMLREMSDLSLKEASQKLGLSTSAMKKACRKLGVERWPIQGAKTPVIQYNSAYVRRLYCKYAKNEEAKKGPSAMPMFDGQCSDLQDCFNMSANVDHPVFMRTGSADAWGGDGNQYFSFPGAESRAPVYEPAAASWPEFHFAGTMEQQLL